MKVKLNWLGHGNYVARENGNFEKKGNDNKNRQTKPDFYIIKKEKKALEKFSMLLIDEFNGLKISELRENSLTSFPEYSRKDDTEGKKLTVDNELKAVNFLNGYWA